ncbi:MULTISPECIES: hypothetical protein [unclassified Acinetobacter]|uniref:hypothetical protein n=1 Tax=unclassified Acinetobacter TaxID=196816 RepID=UPI00293517A3|nr:MULTISPECIES: hypothetical protein [unclassified Acinetobacter]WOE33268.1 hypothetical protein QSG84_16030 [Acinetobacter sp. SAAs470]WOE36951.1 hypothetical protein QSG86_00855 [Acinetobacter sp. SAAs474]
MLSSLIVTPGFAQEKTSNTSSAHLEFNQVFDIEKFDNIQVLELSRQEMKDTQGAAIPLMAVGAGFGGLYGGLGYPGSSTATGKFSWSGLGTSIAVGAASGAVGGPIGSAVGRYLTPRLHILVGVPKV